MLRQLREEGNFKSGKNKSPLPFSMECEQNHPAVGAWGLEHLLHKNSGGSNPARDI